MRKRYKNVMLDSKKFLAEIKPRPEPGERKSIYVSDREWKIFVANCGHYGASLILENFIRQFNAGIKKKD